MKNSVSKELLIFKNDHYDETRYKIVAESNCEKMYRAEGLLDTEGIRWEEGDYIPASTLVAHPDRPSEYKPVSEEYPSHHALAWRERGDNRFVTIVADIEDEVTEWLLASDDDVDFDIDATVIDSQSITVTSEEGDLLNETHYFAVRQEGEVVAIFPKEVCLLSDVPTLWTQPITNPKLLAEILAS